MFKKNVFVVLLLLSAEFAWSQSGESYTVVVPTVFSPTLSDAQQKINEKANIVDTVVVKQAVSYNIFSPVYTAQFTPEPIAAPKVGRDQITRLYRNFIKFGFGNYWTPYLDFEVNSLRSTQYAFGVKAFHHSTWGKIKGYAPAHHSDSRLGLFGQKFFKDYTLYASADYNHLLATAYGIPDSMARLNIKNQYHHVRAQIDFSNNFPKDAHKFNQFYGLAYDFFSGEHLLAFKTDLNQDIKMAKITYLNLGGEMGFNYYTNPGWTDTNPIVTANGQLRGHDDITFNLKPYASLNYKEYVLKAGVNIFVHAHLGGETKLHVYPDIQARLHIVPNIFTVYAGLDGGMKRNSLLSYVQENPNLIVWFPTGFMDEKMRFFGGLKVGLSRSLSIGAKASHAICKDMPFFVNHEWIFAPPFIGYSRYNEFDVLFYDVQHTNLHFDLSYTYKQQLFLTLNLDYNLYKKPKELLKPWYKPAFVGNLDARYILLNKFVFNLSTFLHTGIYAPKFVEEGINAQKLRPAVDFNFGFEYIWSKRLSLFANVNNFICRRNYYFFDYPTQRINCLVGVKYNFGGESLKK